MKAYFFICLLSLSLFSCQKEQSASVIEDDEPPSDTCITPAAIPAIYPTGTVLPVDTNQTFCGFMPFSKNNYWVYLDSLYDNNGQFTQSRIDTLRFTRTRMTPDSIIWWMPDKWKGFFDYNYSTDTMLYTLGSNWEGRPSVPWAYMPVGDSSKDNFNYTDYTTWSLAWKLNGSVVVPAGSFTQCVLLRKKYFIAQDLDIWFKPGTGILKFSMYLTPQPGNPQLREVMSSTLLSYYIE